MCTAGGLEQRRASVVEGGWVLVGPRPNGKSKSAEIDRATVLCPPCIREGRLSSQTSDKTTFPPGVAVGTRREAINRSAPDRVRQTDESYAAPAGGCTLRPSIYRLLQGRLAIACSRRLADASLRCSARCRRDAQLPRVLEKQNVPCMCFTGKGWPSVSQHRWRFRCRGGAPSTCCTAPTPTLGTTTRCTIACPYG